MGKQCTNVSKDTLTHVHTRVCVYMHTHPLPLSFPPLPWTACYIFWFQRSTDRLRLRHYNRLTHKEQKHKTERGRRVNLPSSTTVTKCNKYCTPTIVVVGHILVQQTIKKLERFKAKYVVTVFTFTPRVTLTPRLTLLWVLAESTIVDVVRLVLFVSIAECQGANRKNLF